jgi:hypothetical protein
MVETFSYLVYTSLAKLPLSVFIDCSVDADFRGLLIEGEAPDDVLQGVWDDIQQSYVEQMGGAEVELSLQLYKRIHKLSANLVQVHVLLDTLLYCFVNNVVDYVKQFSDQLNSLLNTAFPFDVTNRESYNKNLQSCLTRASKIEIDIELKQGAWEEIQKKEGSETQQVTREYFIEILTQLGNHKSVPLTDSISTYEFVYRIKLLNKELEKLNSK